MKHDLSPPVCFSFQATDFDVSGITIVFGAADFGESIMPAWMIEAIGMAAAIIGTIGWLPQAIKTIRARDTSGLSFWGQA